MGDVQVDLGEILLGLRVGLGDQAESCRGCSGRWSRGCSFWCACTSAGLLMGMEVAVEKRGIKVATLVLSCLFGCWLALDRRRGGGRRGNQQD